MKRIFFFLVLAVSLLTGCNGELLTGFNVDDSTVVNWNLNRDEQNFREFRRVVFYNGITGEYILQVEGFLALNIDMDGDLVVTVKQSDGTFLKHYLGLSDNVTWFSESLDPRYVSDKQYKVVFKPISLIPTFEQR